MKATLQKINTLAAEEFQIPADLYFVLLALQHTKTPVTVTGVGCEGDGTFEGDYHNVTLPDGTELHAISGLHLQRC